jgi:predicted nucleotidyltransferase
MPISEETVQGKIEELAATFRQVLSQFPSLALRAVFLYGSVLGPGFRADSDIDLAVLDDADDRLSFGDQARLMDALERTTGRGVDLRMLRESSLSHQAHVLEQGRLLWWREPRGEVERYAREVRGAVAEERERVAQAWSALLLKLTGSAATRG